MTTPREAAIDALELRQPQGLVPTFELEFQLTEELFGVNPKPFLQLQGLERDQAITYNMELAVRVAERLDYSIIRVGHPDEIRRLIEMGAHTQYLLCGESDGTMAIPDGDNMTELAMELFEAPDEVHARLEKSCLNSMEWGTKLVDAGADVLTMCADYCFNQAPFLSPQLFSEFVTPYLARSIEHYRSLGAYVIKHTDGNIMPILDQLVSCHPHALHSLDPQAGVDMKVMKETVGDKVCLCGNVNCALMQTGTDEQVRESAVYALTHGMPGGGYIYCTSNVAFKGLALERYLMILDIRQELGRYS